MSELALKLLLDISVACLLVATIYYCTKLNKRVKMLQDSKSELAQLIRQFDESTQQAMGSINEIHKASKKINENIQAKLDKANYLADDLAFMIERANKTADRIEQQITGGRQAVTASAKAELSGSAASPASVAPRRSREPEPEATPEPARRAERTTQSTRTSTQEQPQSASSQEKKGIEAMMERISELRAGKDDATRAKRPVARLRSKSEQDLLQALKERKGQA